MQHVGSTCDKCGTEPIQGVQWHCQACLPEMSLDFCDSGSDCPHETDTHMEDHQLESVYRPETFLETTECCRALVIMTLTQSTFRQTDNMEENIIYWSFSTHSNGTTVPLT